MTGTVQTVYKDAKRAAQPMSAAMVLSAYCDGNQYRVILLRQTAQASVRLLLFVIKLGRDIESEKAAMICLNFPHLRRVDEKSVKRLASCSNCHPFFAFVDSSFLKFSPMARKGS